MRANNANSPVLYVNKKKKRNITFKHSGKKIHSLSTMNASLTLQSLCVEFRFIKA